MPPDATRVSFLVRLRNAGDQEAWREFSEHYGTWMSAWLRRRGIPPQDADDVQQEAALLVLQKIRVFEHNGNPGAFRCWLHQILRNSVKRVVRRAQRQPRAGAAGLSEIAAGLEDPRSELFHALERELQGEFVRQAFESVSPYFDAKTIAMVKRVVLEERTAGEVAKEFDVEPGTVRVSRHRVLKKIRELNPNFLEG